MLNECEPYQSELSCVCLSAYGGVLSFVRYRQYG